jgi:hypothetical protein
VGKDNDLFKFSKTNDLKNALASIPPDCILEYKSGFCMKKYITFKASNEGSN